MGAPQIILIVLLAIGGTITLAQHGTWQVREYNFVTWSIVTAVEVGLLYWGGFFG